MLTTFPPPGAGCYPHVRLWIWTYVSYRILTHPTGCPKGRQSYSIRGGMRPEGPAENRPGRQAGIPSPPWNRAPKVRHMCRPFGPQCLDCLHPALTRGAILCRRFAPGSREFSQILRESRRASNEMACRYSRFHQISSGLEYGPNDCIDSSRCQRSVHPQYQVCPGVRAEPGDLPT
jgi:hypothetical protein